MTPDRVPPPVSILLGRADEARAEMLVRVHDAARPAGDPPRLVGTLTGPRRGRDTTLPTSVPLAACGPSEAVETRAIFTEPAYWTPEMPNLYRFEARLLLGERPLAAYDRWIGLRRFGVRGRSLWLDGRRWVPRGVAASADSFSPHLLHTIHASAEMRDPASGHLAAADQAGVAIVARLEDASGRPFDHRDACGRIAAWSLHPSVMMVIVPQTMPTAVAEAVAAEARAAKGTMLVALEVDGTLPPVAVQASLAAAFDALVVDLPDDAMPHDDWREWIIDKPLVARRRMPKDGGQAAGDEAAVAGRRECDRLQASLAAWGLAGGNAGPGRDWAGYLSTAW